MHKPWNVKFANSSASIKTIDQSGFSTEIEIQFVLVSKKSVNVKLGK